MRDRPMHGPLPLVRRSLLAVVLLTTVGNAARAQAPVASALLATLTLMRSPESIATMRASSEAPARGPMLASVRAGVGRPVIVHEPTPSPFDSLGDSLGDSARAHPPRPPRAERARTSGRIPARLISGAVGGFSGALAGASIATRLLPQSQCGDDPGLCEAIPGALVGGIVGAALLAAAPLDRGVCTFRQRAGRAVMGSLVGGLFVGAAAGDPLSAAILGVPIGGAIGGALSAGTCATRVPVAAAGSAGAPPR